MGRRVDLDNVVGAVEIAERLGVSRAQVVYEWRRRHADFPQPVKRLSVGNLWLWSEVAAWAKRTGRL